jgi:predicted ATPase
MLELSEQFLRSVRLKRDEINSFDEYPFNMPAVRNLDTLDFHPKVTYFIGENGTGKSTLLEALAVCCRLNPEGGSRNFNFGTRDSHSDLHSYLKIVRGTRRLNDAYFLRAESFFNAATYLEDINMSHTHGDRLLHEQSHGESFWSTLTTRFSGDMLIFLDEPEAALSPPRQLAALARIHQLVQKNAQFIIATHSPILMAYPDATIYLLGADGMEHVEYKETEHYQVTRDFLNRSDAMLEELLADNDPQQELDLPGE